MGNKASKKQVTDEDMEFLMKQVQDASLGTQSTFYQLNFTDSGHTKAKIQVCSTFLYILLVSRSVLLTVIAAL